MSRTLLRRARISLACCPSRAVENIALSAAIFSGLLLFASVTTFSKADSAADLLCTIVDDGKGLWPSNMAADDEVAMCSGEI